MDYNKIYIDNNKDLEERFELVFERIKLINNEETVEENYRDYFFRLSNIFLQLENILKISMDGNFRNLSLESLKSYHDEFFLGLREADYNKTYLNPDFAKEKLGEEYGKYLSYLMYEVHKLTESAYSCKMEKLLIYAELFVEIYNLFETEEKNEKSLKEIIYWFNHDYSEVLSDYMVYEMVNPEYNFATSIVLEADLDDPKYLYYYGEYIGENEIGSFDLLKEFDEEKLKAIAKTYTEGFVKGFERSKKDLSIKKNVEIRYPIGFEKVVKYAIVNFREIGLEPVIRRLSYTSTPVNRQLEYDHRYDIGLVFDKCIKDRMVTVRKNSFEKNKEMAAFMAGPAVIETFGEKPFKPEFKENAIKFDDKQKKLDVDMKNEMMQIVLTYIKQEERSFTIIAYPIAEIGSKYRDIFNDVISINNLDEDKYKNIQENIIKSLDKGEKVQITGRNGNKTDIIIALNNLENSDTETLFENCLADVNIPVGEVFTSPKLSGTNGLLHIKETYLRGLKFEDLQIRFEDGFIKDYSCKNFDDDIKNKDYIKENLLMNHETLPIGEFAIGTNTTAYVIGQKYNIVNILPILIVEKMGPHFAIGDTCYSHEEDEETFNPDGKKIIAKSNEISREKYFNCHTDITIPYDELGDVLVINKKGDSEEIIKDGRFVLVGTEELNLPLDKKVF